MDRVLIGKDLWNGYWGHDVLKKWPIVDRGTSSVTIPKSTVRDVFRLQEPLKAVELVKKLLCMCRTLFLFIHFAVVLYDNNVKLVETCQLHVLWRKCRMSSCSLPKFSRKKESPLLLLRTRSPKTTEKLG